MRPAPNSVPCGPMEGRARDEARGSAISRAGNLARLEVRSGRRFHRVHDFIDQSNEAEVAT